MASSSDSSSGIHSTVKSGLCGCSTDRSGINYGLLREHTDTICVRIWCELRTAMDKLIGYLDFTPIDHSCGSSSDVHSAIISLGLAELQLACMRLFSDDIMLHMPGSVDALYMLSTEIGCIVRSVELTHRQHVSSLLLLGATLTQMHADIRGMRAIKKACTV